jgi:hypothetical protein
MSRCAICHAVEHTVGTSADLAMQLFRARRVAENHATTDEAVALARDVVPLLAELVKVLKYPHRYHDESVDIGADVKGQGAI